MRFGTQPAAIQGDVVSLVTINGITAMTSCLVMLASRAFGGAYQSGMTLIAALPQKTI
jgi:hypothetical protein